MINREQSKMWNMMKRMAFFTALAVVSSFSAKAQQIPLYASYMFNPMLLSPTHAGTGSEDARIFAMSRLQLVGIDGAPTTFMLTGDAPIAKYNMGLGAKVFSDRYGLLGNTGFGLNYSYKINIGDDFRLHLGIGGDISQLALNFDEIRAQDMEESLLQGSANKLLFNGTAGIHMEYKDFELGFASPQVYGTRVVYQDYISNTGINYNSERHYLAWMRYRFAVKYDVFDLEPMVVMRSVGNADPQFDINIRGIIKDQVFVSVGLRSGYAVSVGAGAFLGNNMTLAYSTDIATGDIRGSSWGGHEFTLGYRFYKSLDRREVDELVKERQKEQKKELKELYQQKVDSVGQEMDEIEEVNSEQQKEIDRLQGIVKRHSMEIDSMRKANEQKLRQAKGGFDVNGDGVINNEDDTNGDGTIDRNDFIKNNEGEVVVPKKLPGKTTKATDENWNKPHGKYVVVIASFKKQSDAIEHVQMLKRTEGADPSITRSQSGTWYYVFNKSYMDPNEAQTYLNGLSTEGLPDFMHPWIYVFD